MSFFEMGSRVPAKWNVTHYCDRLVFSFVCLAILVMAGCSGSNVKQYVRPSVDTGSIRTVAVLPFKNLTTDTFAAEKIRSKVGIELLSRGINVIEPGEISFAMKELRIRSTSSLRTEHLVTIGELLNADKIITGSVESYAISNGVTVSYPEVSVHLVMYDSGSGEVVWSLWNTSGGASFMTRHFGAEGVTLDDLSRKVIEESFSTFLHDWKPVFTKQQSPAEMLRQANVMRNENGPAPERRARSARADEAPEKVEVMIQFAPSEEAADLPVEDPGDTEDAKPSQEAERDEDLPKLGSIFPAELFGTTEQFVYINELPKEK